MTRRRLPLVTALVAVLVAAGCSAQASPSASVSPTASPTPTASPVPSDGDALPNLLMTTLADWRIEVDDAGRRLLRMTTIFSNGGVGAFELQGTRSGTTDQDIPLDQIVFDTSGGSRRVPTAVVARFAGGGHDHWHAQGVVTLALSRAGNPAEVTNGDKVHFCFFDNVRYDTDLPSAPASGVYQRDWCGAPDVTAIRMGLSVGWGDRYGWDFAYQWLDITNLPAGTYDFRATVDAADDFLEIDDTDNCTLSVITIPATGVGEIVVVEAAEQPC